MSARKGQESERIVLALLAAGRSSRMGSPKSLLEIDGERALARLLRFARACALEPLVVLGFDAERVRAGVALDGVQLVVNPRPERGQSSSVRAAAQALASPASFALLPVDHARLREATLRKLAEAFRVREPGVAIVVPSYRGRRGHPLFGDDGVRCEFAALADDEPAHVVVRRDARRILHVEVDDPAVVEDLDTPDDLRRAPRGRT